MPLPARTPLPSSRGNNAAAAQSKIPALCAVARAMEEFQEIKTHFLVHGA